MNKNNIARLMVLTLLSGAVQAEALEEAWALALQNDQALRAVRMEADAARSDTSAARAQRLPTLSASGSYMQFKDAPAFDFSAAGIPVQLPEIVDDDNTVIGSVTVSLPIFTSGRISNSIAAASAQQSARESGETQAVQDLKLAVAQAYVDVLRAQRALAVADSNVQTLQGYSTEAQSMFDREVVPRNDLLAAQVALANATQTRISVANALDIARAAYNRRLGQPLEREVVVDQQLPSIQIEQSNLEQLVDRALSRRPELAAIASQTEAVHRQSRAERARLYPQVMLSGGYSYLENQALDREDFAIASIGFNWAVFDGGVTRHRTDALRSAQRALEARRADLATLIELDVRQSWLNVRETQSRIGATAGAVAQAEENLRITRQQYLAGLVISTRVLEAETLRVQSRTNHDNAQLDASLASYRLARAIGEL